MSQSSGPTCNPSGLPDHAPEDVGQGAVAGSQTPLPELTHEGGRVLGCRNQQSTDSFRENADQRGDERLAHSRHLPVEPVRRHPVEHLDGDVDGDTVLGVARLKPVRHHELEVALPPHRRVCLGVDLVRAVREQQILGERQQPRVRTRGLLPPRVEVSRRDH
jgi:hypothetical protein